MTSGENPKFPAMIVFFKLAEPKASMPPPLLMPALLAVIVLPVIVSVLPEPVEIPAPPELAELEEMVLPVIVAVPEVTRIAPPPMLAEFPVIALLVTWSELPPL